MQKKKIGEILIENGLITKEILNQALAYQAKFGGSVTQYLIARNFLGDEDLAKCISIQFGLPYLPLRAYDIPHDIIELIPSSVAQKYLLMPVDRIKNIVTLVMADPFDDDAIKEIEKITNCKVQPFVGIISDIIKAIEKYYDVHIEYTDFEKEAPFFIAVDNYVGVERRKSLRLKAPIEVHFPEQDKYKKTVTKDVSMHGFLFESDNILPVGAYLTMEVMLPEEISPYPIACVVQVVRVVPLAKRKFDIGAKVISMAREDINKVIKRALSLNKP